MGEVSIVTMNILAPFYNALAVENWDDRMDFLKKDRTERVPLAINMAKQHNADILCLQEVEGGTDELESVLKHLLAEPLTVDDGNHKLEGYDMFLWSSLLPNRADNVVGNCVAWRSSRHKLVAVDSFKRGMVCQMQEIDQGATFCVANVHLPARPSNVMGRLKSMSHTIEKMARLDPKMRKSPLDGLCIVAGDFNCDQNSVTAKLLTTGYSPYGNLKDRNYKANVSKASAFMMRHDYRFKDVYEKRRDVAPVTVSLTGRGPGCTDHLFFAQNRAPGLDYPGHERYASVGITRKPALSVKMDRRN
jgi:endonuclease/exonuclease/phosphatase family metal-dependent hydrolase